MLGTVQEGKVLNLHEEEHQAVVEAVEQALSQLLEKKAFFEIRVNELAKKAGIARSTFYRNYTSIEDVVRHSIQRTLSEFNRQYKPSTVSERFEPKYISDVWNYVIKYDSQIRLMRRTGLSELYLEEINRHLISIYGENLSTQDKLELYAVAGAQYNIIFNLAAGSDADMKNLKFKFELESCL